MLGLARPPGRLARCLPKLGKARWPMAGTARAAAVHDFRKAMKRWRALLRLLERLLGDDAERRPVDARDLMRTSGPAMRSRRPMPLADLSKQRGGNPARSPPPARDSIVRGG